MGRVQYAKEGVAPPTGCTLQLQGLAGEELRMAVTIEMVRARRAKGGLHSEDTRANCAAGTTTPEAKGPSGSAGWHHTSRARL